MEKTFKVTNDKGYDFLVRIIEKGLMNSLN
jgi:hypothetical protein